MCFPSTFSAFFPFSYLPFRWRSFFLLLPTPLFSLSTCANCKTPTTSRLIGHSTPFPFYPAHFPPAIDELSEPVDLLEDAYRSYTTLSGEHFPLCVECAEKSAYPPLREFSAFAQRSGAFKPRLPSGWQESVSSGGVRFEGYVARKREGGQSQREGSGGGCGEALLERAGGGEELACLLGVET